ncbi:MAG: hypothetical protein AAF297_11225 [Planctomycetota bacterium]
MEQRAPSKQSPAGAIDARLESLLADIDRSINKAEQRALRNEQAQSRSGRQASWSPPAQADESDAEADASAENAETEPAEAADAAGQPVAEQPEAQTWAEDMDPDGDDWSAGDWASESDESEDTLAADLASALESQTTPPTADEPPTGDLPADPQPPTSVPTAAVPTDEPDQIAPSRINAGPADPDQTDTGQTDTATVDSNSGDVDLDELRTQLSEAIEEIQAEAQAEIDLGPPPEPDLEPDSASPSDPEENPAGNQPDDEVNDQPSNQLSDEFSVELDDEPPLGDIVEHADEEEVAEADEPQSADASTDASADDSADDGAYPETEASPEPEGTVQPEPAAVDQPEATGSLEDELAGVGDTVPPEPTAPSPESGDDASDQTTPVPDADSAPPLGEASSTAADSIASLDHELADLAQNSDVDGLGHVENDPWDAEGDSPDGAVIEADEAADADDDEVTLPPPAATRAPADGATDTIQDGTAASSGEPDAGERVAKPDPAEPGASEPVTAAAHAEKREPKADRKPLGSILPPKPDWPKIKAKPAWLIIAWRHAVWAVPPITLWLLAHARHAAKAAWAKLQPPTIKALEAAHKPLEKLDPKLRQGVGWVGAYTCFLAACLWIFVLFVQGPTMPETDASPTTLGEPGTADVAGSDIDYASAPTD